MVGLVSNITRDQHVSSLIQPLVVFSRSATDQPTWRPASLAPPRGASESAAGGPEEDQVQHGTSCTNSWVTWMVPLVCRGIFGGIQRFSCSFLWNRMEKACPRLRRTMQSEYQNRVVKSSSMMFPGRVDLVVSSSNGPNVDLQKVGGTDRCP